MVVFRWLSLLLMVMAVMLLGADVVGTLEKKAIVVRSLHDILVLFHYDARPGLIEMLPVDIANASLVVIGSPGWLLIGFLGIVFAIFVPRPKPIPRPQAPPIMR